MTAKRKTSAGNRVFMANLGTAGTFALHCGHRELKQMEALLDVKITELDFDSVRTMDCCLYCMIQRDAAAKGVAVSREWFDNALDSISAAQYLQATKNAAACFAAAFDVLRDGAEDAGETGEGDEKNVQTPPADGTGTEVW